MPETHEYTVTKSKILKTGSLLQPRQHTVECGLDDSGDVVFMLDGRALFWITKYGQFVFSMVFRMQVNQSGLSVVNHDRGIKEGETYAYTAPFPPDHS